MKPLFEFLKRLWRRYFPSNLDRINAKLEKVVIEQEIARKKLKNDIAEYAYRRFAVKISNFIPPKGVNTYKIYRVIERKFADDIKDLSLILRPNLTWK